jgi:glycosyltransferase involved in cell wall biosynthesis
MHKILLISYVFPPGAGAGVQRAVKFSKYLPHWGWQPVVLSADPHSVPMKDASLLDDLPSDLALYRAPTIEPKICGDSAATAAKPGGLSGLKLLIRNLLFPDRHILWLPLALPYALRIARKQQVRAIMVTAPPFSTMFLGWAVARLCGLPLVLDFRDDWAGLYTHSYGIQKGGITWKKAVIRSERFLTRAASLVIGNTPSLTQRLISDHGGGASFTWIPNGYDADDFIGLEPHRPPELPDGRLHILYTGTVFEGSPLHHFWEGVARLPQSLREKLWVEVVGRVVPGQTADPGLPGLEVKVREYEPHAQVLSRMLGADLLLLTLGSQADETRVVPAKLYEYMAARRPVLALVPPTGEAGKLVSLYKLGRVIHPDRPQEVAQALEAYITQPPRITGGRPLAFDRRMQAWQLADELSKLLK